MDRCPCRGCRQPIAGKTIFKGTLKSKERLEGIGIPHNHNDSSCCDRPFGRQKCRDAVCVCQGYPAPTRSAPAVFSAKKGPHSHGHGERHEQRFANSPCSAYCCSHVGQGGRVPIQLIFDHNLRGSGSGLCHPAPLSPAMGCGLHAPGILPSRACRTTRREEPGQSA